MENKKHRGRARNDFKKGDRIGLWTVLGYSGKTDKHGNALFVCRCECGEKFLVRSFSLKNGRSKGCKRCRNARYKDECAL